MANAEQLKILRTGAAAWNEWREETRLLKPDLADADLTDLNLSRVNLSEANLRRADLSFAHLSGANLCVANLSGANLNFAHLSGARLIGADLSGAYLSSAVLTGAELNIANLSRTDFTFAHLSVANLSVANLTSADFTFAHLSGANLNGANLSGARLSSAALSGADMSAANLSDADLSAANLSDAELLGADLSRTNLSRANLDNASFSRARLAYTCFAFTSLKTAKGLESCKHLGPSALDQHVLLESGVLPKVFLRGCGLSNELIQTLPSFVNSPTKFYSCFISFSHANRSFARWLHDGLQRAGVRCWLDEKQILPDDLLHRAADENARPCDKLLLCCSATSLTSWWIDKEIQKALLKEERLAKEPGHEGTVIVPLNLDGVLFDPKWDDWKRQHLTNRFASDFVGWTNGEGRFDLQLEFLIKALRADLPLRSGSPFREVSPPASLGNPEFRIDNPQPRPGN